MSSFNSSGVPLSRTLTAGAGMTGGGDLSANRTFDVVGAASGGIVVAANEISVDQTFAPTWTATHTFSNAAPINLSGTAPVIKTTAVDQNLFLQGNSNAASTGADLILRTTATRTAGSLLLVRNNATNRFTVAYHGGIDIPQGAAVTGVAQLLTVTGAAHTNQTASTEASDVSFNLSRTVTHSTGAIATQRSCVITPVTHAFVAASTITDAATFAISGSPVAGANATITNSFSLWVQAGATKIAGNVGFFTSAPASQQSSAALTNNVTAGGVNDTIANFTDLAIYMNDAATIRDDIYQLARKLKEIGDALRLYGLLV